MQAKSQSYFSIIVLFSLALIEYLAGGFRIFGIAVDVASYGALGRSGIQSLTFWLFFTWITLLPVAIITALVSPYAARMVIMILLMVFSLWLAISMMHIFLEDYFDNSLKPIMTYVKQSVFLALPKIPLLIYAIRALRTEENDIVRTKGGVLMLLILGVGTAMLYFSDLSNLEGGQAVASILSMLALPTVAIYVWFSRR